MFGSHFLNQVSPERVRLGVRIIDAKNLDAIVCPKYNDVRHLLPQRLPLRAFKIERIDVFVALGRIFGAANAAVKTMEEPLRMLFYIRMIGRALKGDINGYVQTLFSSSF